MTRQEKLTVLEAAAQLAGEMTMEIQKRDDIIAAKDAEIERLKEELKTAQALAMRRGEIQVQLTQQNTDLRAALRETRAALRQKVFRPPTFYNGSAGGWWTCRECGGRGPMGAIAHLHLCPLAVLARYADLAGEADHV